MFPCLLWTLLAPAVEAAAALPRPFPEPTRFVPALDGWSPAPTAAPEIGAIELLRRQVEVGNNTCGFVSGIQLASVTCSNNNQICATNNYYGVHGCCNSQNFEQSCDIPTTCVPSSLMSASCTDSACLDDVSITKCTASDAPNCYEWHFVYSTSTVMTQHGCAASAFTSTAMRSFSHQDTGSSVSELAAVSYVTVTEAASSTSTAIAAESSNQKSSIPIGAIIGGVIGGLVVIGAVVGAIIICRRRRRKQENIAATGTGHMYGQGPAPGVAEYEPAVFNQFSHDNKASEHKIHPYTPTTPVCAYPGVALAQPSPYIVPEADGRPIHIYEAPN